MSTMVEKAAKPQTECRVNPRFHVRMAYACSVYLAVALFVSWLAAIRIEYVLQFAIAFTAASAMVLLLPIFWHTRRKWNLRDAALTIPWIFVLVMILPLPILPAARLRMPLQDGHFAVLDQALGVKVPALMSWASRHWLGMLVNRSYAILTPLLTVSFWFPALTGKVRHAQRFLVANLAIFTIGLPLFALFPAIGPWYGYHFAPTPDQLKCQSSILALRLPGHFVFRAAPIVCFPSFHVAWAIVCATAYWGFRPLRFPAALLAGMIIVSTMTTGWHYFSDVLGGIVLACLSLAIANLFTRNCESHCRQPEAGSVQRGPETV